MSYQDIKTAFFYIGDLGQSVVQLSMDIVAKIDEANQTCQSASDLVHEVKTSRDKVAGVHQLIANMTAPADCTEYKSDLIALLDLVQRYTGIVIENAAAIVGKEVNQQVNDAIRDCQRTLHKVLEILNQTQRKFVIEAAECIKQEEQHAAMLKELADVYEKQKKAER